MRNVVVKVPNNNCWDCEIKNIYNGKIWCPFSNIGRVSQRPVKACRDAEIAVIGENKDNRGGLR